MKILAVIPARAGSRGIKNKNITKLNKKSLIEYTFLAATKSNLKDIFLITVKYSFFKDNYNIPLIYYNYKQVFYYNKIKTKIDELVEMNRFQDLIIEELLKYEKERHQKNICECGTDETCFNDEKTKELFKDFLDYYFVTNKKELFKKR